VFGQGKPELINTQTDVTLTLGPSDETVSLLITQLMSSIDVLLGADWIARLGIVIDLANQLVLFPNGASVPISPSANIPVEEMSSTQFTKLINSSDDHDVDSCFVIYPGQVPTGSDSCFAAFSGDTHAASSGPTRFREEILKEFPDLFPESLPTTLPPQSRDGHNVEHSIELKPNAPPVKQRDYRRGSAENATLKELLDQMLREGQIRPSTSPWSSPVLLVKKSDGSWRFCVDYRALNAATKKNSYPLPDITTCLDQLHGARFFTSLDLRSGYHQIQVSPLHSFHDSLRQLRVPRDAFWSLQRASNVPVNNEQPAPALHRQLPARLPRRHPDLQRLVRTASSTRTYSSRYTSTCSILLQTVQM